MRRNVLIGTAGSTVLSELDSELKTKLDARVVSVSMYHRNALTLKELQSIQSLRDRPIQLVDAQRAAVDPVSERSPNPTR